MGSRGARIGWGVGVVWSVVEEVGGTGHPLALEPVDLIGQKNVSPGWTLHGRSLAIPLLLHDHRFCYLLHCSLSAFPSISADYISTICSSHFTHRITPWPAFPKRGPLGEAPPLLFLILGRLISEGVKQKWVRFLRPLLLGSADRPERALRTAIVRSSFGEPCRSFVFEVNCFGAQPRAYLLNRAPPLLYFFPFTLPPASHTPTEHRIIHIPTAVSVACLHLVETRARARAPASH